MIRKWCLFCAMLTLISFPGCLFNHSYHRVVRQSEPLQPITFESEATRNVFEDYVESEFENRANRTKSSLAIPFLMSLSHSQSISRAAIRNDAAVQFDVNGDRIISDYEASLDY